MRWGNLRPLDTVEGPLDYERPSRLGSRREVLQHVRRLGTFGT